jgi:hypothetical protein
MSLDLQSLPRALRCTALDYLAGVDVRARVSRMTFWRHRRALLVHGMDIAAARPADAPRPGWFVHVNDEAENVSEVFEVADYAQALGHALRVSEGLLGPLVSVDLLDCFGHVVWSDDGDGMSLLVGSCPLKAGRYRFDDERCELVAIATEAAA